ncbi:MAG: DUF3418 domain-containing protein, partial [Planctomycetota bacterium]
LASHLIERSYSDIEYITERGRVEAAAKVTLGNIEISRGRMVDYGGVNRPEARSVFIREALVEGKLQTDARFVARNTDLLEAIRRREAKLRKPQMPSDEALIRFFDERLPVEVCTARAFDRWRRKAETDNPDLLCMTEPALGCDDPEPVDTNRFPDTLELTGGGRASLVYRVEPGEATDGVEAVLTVADAAEARPEAFEWLIPGWRLEKITAIVRGLPKAIRRQFDPAELAARIHDTADPESADLFTHIADSASRITGLQVTPKMCRAVELPPHLRMSGRVQTDDGKDIARGSDFHELVRAARDHSARSRDLAQSERVWRTWPESEARIEPPRALEDAVGGVRVVRLGDASTAQAVHWFGCRRLVALAVAKDVKRLLQHTPHASRAGAHLQTIDGSLAFVDEVAGMLAEVDRRESMEQPATSDSIARMTEAVRDTLGDRVTRVVALMSATLDARQEALSMIERRRSPAIELACSDVEYQLRQLVHAFTFRRGRWASLVRLPAYVKGIVHRLERLRGDGIARDREAMARVAPHWGRCMEQARREAQIGRQSSSLQRYRWMIEEYRLSLFAPQLSIRKGASERMLEDTWNQVERDAR